MYFVMDTIALQISGDRGHLQYSIGTHLHKCVYEAGAGAIYIYIYPKFDILTLKAPFPMPPHIF